MGAEMRARSNRHRVPRASRQGKYITPGSPQSHRGTEKLRSQNGKADPSPARRDQDDKGSGLRMTAQGGMTTELPFQQGAEDRAAVGWMI